MPSLGIGVLRSALEVDDEFRVGLERHLRSARLRRPSILAAFDPRIAPLLSHGSASLCEERYHEQAHADGQQRERSLESACLDAEERVVPLEGVYGGVRKR